MRENRQTYTDTNRLRERERLLSKNFIRRTSSLATSLLFSHTQPVASITHHRKSNIRFQIPTQVRRIEIEEEENIHPTTKYKSYSNIFPLIQSRSSFYKFLCGYCCCSHHILDICVSLNMANRPKSRSVGL